MSFSLPDEIQHYEKKIYDQRQLIEISRALNSTLDYNYLIQAMLDICLAQVQTMQAALFLTPYMDADFIEMLDGYRGFVLPEPRESYAIPVQSPLVTMLETTNKCLRIADLEEPISSQKEVRALREIGVELMVPLKAKGKVIGLIMLGEKAVGGDYPDSEKSFLFDLASLGGIAVENARLYERATVDMMTGLKNHAYFQSRFREEREKALKRKSPLALLLTDVDRFKNFNDTYGHQAGDEVLKAVARVLIDAARRTDFAARYGGEEFCLVMPGADEATAIAHAENLRKAVEAMSVMHEGKEMKVTMSIGIATFDPSLDARTNKTMVERADKGLYACKHGGRNQVRAYTKDLG
jgi:diguanylate cyclase (GGDEF)-like protein